MKIRAFLGLMVILALLLNACGGGDSGSTAVATAVPAVPTSAPLDTPVVAETPTEAATPTTVSETSALTDTAEITSTEEITGADEITGTDTLTDASGVGTGAGVGITDTTTLTDTAEITGTGDLTSTGVGTASTMADRGVIRASELLDYDVENAQSEDLGSVEDAIVSLQNGCINYLVLSFGGILGLGDDQYLIPWRAVAMQPQQARLLLNIDPDALNDAPIFDGNNLPDMNLPDWDADLTTYWESVAITMPDLELPSTSTTMGITATDDITDTGVTGTDTMTDTTTGSTTGAMTDATGMMGVCGMGGMAQETTTGASTSAGSAMTSTTAATGTIQVETPQAMRLSDLLGYDVKNPQGEDLGSIEDIMVEWRESRLAYGILSFGGFLGLGDKWFILPLDALTLDAVEQRFVFNADPERLQDAPGFDPATLPDTADPNWDEEIRQYWMQNQ